MTEPPTPDPTTPRVYLFGDIAKEEAPQGADPTPLGQRLLDFLSGAYTGPLSEREGALIRDEFIAQETYRARMVDAILRCSGKLQQEAATCVRENDGPYSISATYQTGMNLGKYIGYCDAAQAVQNIINEVSLRTHEDNEKLTAERNARLKEGAEGA